MTSCGGKKRQNRGSFTGAWGQGRQPPFDGFAARCIDNVLPDNGLATQQQVLLLDRCLCFQKGHATF